MEEIDRHSLKTVTKRMINLRMVTFNHARYSFWLPLILAADRQTHINTLIFPYYYYIYIYIYI